jgi:hypothetical protein
MYFAAGHIQKPDLAIASGNYERLAVTAET